MKNIKYTIGGKEYKFKMLNKTILKIDEDYGNYGSVAYGLMEGKKVYTNALKLVSKCCIDKDFTLEELQDKMTSEEFISVVNLAQNLFLDYIGVKEKNQEENQEEDKKEKNN